MSILVNYNQTVNSLAIQPDLLLLLQIYLLGLDHSIYQRALTQLHNWGIGTILIFLIYVPVVV